MILSTRVGWTFDLFFCCRLKPKQPSGKSKYWTLTSSSEAKNSTGVTEEEVVVAEEEDEMIAVHESHERLVMTATAETVNHEDLQGVDVVAHEVLVAETRLLQKLMTSTTSRLWSLLRLES